MIITCFGIIQLSQVWRIISLPGKLVKLIKSKSPVIQVRSLQVYGRDVAYICLRQRHEVSLNPISTK